MYGENIAAIFSQNSPSFHMVRVCGQNLLAFLRQYIRPLDPASARNGRRRIMSAAVAQIETAIFMRAR